MENIKGKPKLEAKVGDYIVKNNYMVFNRNTNPTPVLEIKKITCAVGKNGGFSAWVFNGTSRLLNGTFRVVNEDEAHRILEIWEDSKNISPISNNNVNTKCVREDNNQPKVTYKGVCGWRNPLFIFRMKNPDGGFQAYECPECNNVHIGKTII